MSEKRRIRILRLIEYIGDPDWLRRTMRKSIRFDGTVMTGEQSGCPARGIPVGKNRSLLAITLSNNPEVARRQVAKALENGL